MLGLVEQSIGERALATGICLRLLAIHRVLIEGVLDRLTLQDGLRGPSWPEAVFPLGPTMRPWSERSLQVHPDTPVRWVFPNPLPQLVCVLNTKTSTTAASAP